MEQPSTASTPPRPTVLVADDDPALRRALASMLRSAGYRPLEAEDGWRALELLHQHDVDLVITDIDMPRIDGFELLLAMAAQFPHVPAIVLTGMGVTASERLLALRPGLRIFIKPLNPDALLCAVSDAISPPEQRVE